MSRGTLRRVRRRLRRSFSEARAVVFSAGLRGTVAVVILGLQALGIVRARFVDTRYFAWAPYDKITLYKITLEVDGRRLESAEVYERYRLPARGRDNRAPQHVINILRQVESTYGAHDSARVRLSYRVNGRPPREWLWPAR